MSMRASPGRSVSPRSATCVYPTYGPIAPAVADVHVEAHVDLHHRLRAAARRGDACAAVDPHVTGREAKSAERAEHGAGLPRRERRVLRRSALRERERRPAELDAEPLRERHVEHEGSAAAPAELRRLRLGQRVARAGARVDVRSLGARRARPSEHEDSGCDGCASHDITSHRRGRGARWARRGR